MRKLFLKLHNKHHQENAGAIDAERAVEAMKKAEYMESYVGTEYEVTISSITRFGFFVSFLPNTIEGLVHMSTL